MWGRLLPVCWKQDAPLQRGPEAAHLIESALRGGVSLMNKQGNEVSGQP